MRNYPPEKVVLAVLRAVLGRRRLVPVNAEAWITYGLSRIAPSGLRLLARRSSERSIRRLERLGGG
jgi:hypothetical protein